MPFKIRSVISISVSKPNSYLLKQVTILSQGLTEQKKSLPYKPNIIWLKDSFD